MAAGVTNGDLKTSGKRGHPKLRGGQPAYPHKFNSRQMRALAALCDTFVPSLNLETAGLAQNGSNSTEFSAKSKSDVVSAYYGLGAVEEGVPEQVAGMFTQRLKSRPLFLLGAGLWLLSSYLGTLIMCGFLCFSWRFPFIHPFHDMTLERREKALRSWSHSPIPSLRQTFKLLKAYCLFSFYSKVDAAGQNPSWNAIGYSGPASQLSTSTEAVSTSRQRPLDGKVLDAETAGADDLRAFLENGGFSVLGDVFHLQSLSDCDETGKTVIGVSCDAVVVGSGSGGGVAAGVLATGGQKVLVLEQGQYFARNDFTLLEYPAITNMYLGGGVLASECGAVNVLAGATVGGGSTVNWCASFQTPEHVRREWAEDLGLSFFSTDEYQQAMDAVCKAGGVHSNCRHESFQNSVLRKGCEELGVDIGDIPRNVTSQHSCGFCNMGCVTGDKRGTSETWLVDAANNGALILSSCKAKSVLHQGNSRSTSDRSREAVGVVAEFGNVVLYVKARATVVSCGALSTPPLLLLSGFQNRNIGRNFHCHPVIMAWGYFPEGKGPEGTIYDGPIMTAVSKQVANWESKASAYGSLLEVPILHPGSYGSVIPWTSGSQHKEIMRKYARTSHFLVLCRDRGSGRVMLDKNAKTTKILYNVQTEDLKIMMEGLELGLRAMVAAGATEIGTHHIDGETFDVSTCTPNELEKYLRRVKSTAFECIARNNLGYPVCSAHQMSTCRMGTDPQTSVVDSSGEMWEAQNLFITDASVFPTASGPTSTCRLNVTDHCRGRLPATSELQTPTDRVDIFHDYI
ncbi:hypothetical protein R1flu_017375 [Riccia fluitans]|uniref:Long-chain-alcohol oxidase n=1 Tax=Riccia fluitans TaxID=41844 RepID=A0ABD1ZCS0_9MARC